MSKFRTSRKLPEAFTKRDLKIDENGRPLCRWCQGEVEGLRKSFCSDKCVHEWNLRTSTSYLRSQVFIRDKGICLQCKLDTVGLKKSLFEDSEPNRLDRLKNLKLSLAEYKRTLWEADHILSVKDGGGWSGLSNIQTLCIWCHKAKTKLRGKK